MTHIKDDLTIKGLKKVMSFLRDGGPDQENVVEAVHTLLQRPENIFYRTLATAGGCG